MKGFTLTEILVSLVLLTGVGAVSLSSFSSLTKMINTDQSVAYDFGRGLIERMWEEVRQDTWTVAGEPLSLTSPSLSNTTSTINGKTLTATYQINGVPSNQVATPIDLNGDGIEDYRKVKMTVSW